MWHTKCKIQISQYATIVLKLVPRREALVYPRITGRHLYYVANLEKSALCIAVLGKLGVYLLFLSSQLRGVSQ